MGTTTVDGVEQHAAFCRLAALGRASRSEIPALWAAAVDAASGQGPRDGLERLAGGNPCLLREVPHMKALAREAVEAIDRDIFASSCKALRNRPDELNAYLEHKASAPRRQHLKALEPRLPHEAVAITGWCLLFGMADRDGQRFTKSTDLGPVMRGPVVVPMLANHDARQVIGCARLERRDEGVVAECLLQAREPAVKSFVASPNNPFGFSTGAECAAGQGAGEVRVHRILELSLVREPTQPALKALAGVAGEHLAVLRPWRPAFRGVDDAATRAASEERHDEAMGRFQAHGLAAFGVR